MSVNFFSGYDNPDFHDQNSGNIQSGISELMNGNIGKLMAANSSGKIRRQALDNLRMISNTQGIGRNAAVLSRLTDKTQASAGEGIIDAQLAGSRLDTQNMIQGTQLAQQDRQFKYNDFQRKLERSDRQSPFAALLTSAAGQAAGTFLGYGAAKGAQSLFGAFKTPVSNTGTPEEQSGGGSWYENNYENSTFDPLLTGAYQSGKNTADAVQDSFRPPKMPGRYGEFNENFNSYNGAGYDY